MGFTAPGDVLDAGNSGTVMRFLAGLLAAQPFESVITGDDSLRGRPMARVIDPSRSHGRQDRGGPRVDRRRCGFPAARFGASSITHRWPAPRSRRPCSSRAATHRGKQSWSSLPRRAITASSCSPQWVPISRPRALVSASGPARLRALDVAVPGDISSAAYWITLGAAHPDADVTVTAVGLNPSRTGIFDILRSMGADNSRRERAGTLAARGSATSGPGRAGCVGQSWGATSSRGPSTSFP